MVEHEKLTNDGYITHSVVEDRKRSQLRKKKLVQHERKTRKPRSYLRINIKAEDGSLPKLSPRFIHHLREEHSDKQRAPIPSSSLVYPGNATWLVRISILHISRQMISSEASPTTVWICEWWLEVANPAANKTSLRSSWREVNLID